MAIVPVSISEITKLTGLKKDVIVENLNELGAPVDDEADGELFVEVTPNRPDFYSIEGLVRALNSYNGKANRKYSAKESEYVLNVDASVAKVRPYIVAALIKNVRMNDETIKSLIQLQEKLHDTIGRKRKKVAIGIHNADVIKAPLVYKAVADESFIPLDFEQKMSIKQILEQHPKGKAYVHLVNKIYPMLYDQIGVVSFPPIINGNRTRVGEKTKNLFVDITGTNKKTIEGALNIICCALADRGAEIYQVKIENEYYPDLKANEMELDFEAIQRLLGEKIAQKKMFENLQRLGWIIDGNKAYVAPYRMDVSHYSDAAEDIAIAHGYNNFKPTVPAFFTPGKLADNHQIVRQAMVNMGFIEAVNNALTNKTDVDGKKALKIINPKTQDFTVLRMKIADSILDNLVLNKNHELPIKMFEIGQVYDNGEKTNFAFAIAADSMDFALIRGVLQTLFEQMDVEFELNGVEDLLFIKGRCANIIIKNEIVGKIGEISLKKLVELGIEVPLGLCEINLK